MRLVYVESPFQLMQAVELERQSKNVVFLIRLNNLARNNQQLKELVKVFGLRRVIYLPAKYKAALLIFIWPLIFMSLFSKRLYVGDENSIAFKLVRKFIDREKIILLDDGVATLNSKSAQFYKRYTIFDGVAGCKNPLSECSRIVNSKEDPIKVNVIVGSKLVEEGICDQNSYFNLLDSMIDSIADSGYKTIYVPHRGESLENLSAISSRYGFEVVENRLPIELIGYELSVIPVNIYSIMSTALFSMSLIYITANVRVYPLESDKILSRKEGIENIYKIMKENSLFS